MKAGKDVLAARERERDALLRRITTGLKNDPRVAAAWLFGSLGRGDQDALSDLDLFLIVAEEHSEAIQASIREFVAPFGELLLVVEAPQNAPQGGAYLMALYAGQTGPHQVDWYWQAQSRAKVPTQTAVLFDRVGLPRDTKSTTFDAMNPGVEWDIEKAVANAVCSFWAMLLITAKYAFRTPDEAQMPLLPYVLKPLREAAAFAQGAAEIAVEAAVPHPTFAGKLERLRALAGEMTALMPQLAMKGVAVPADIVPQAVDYLYFLEQAHQQRSEETNV